MRLINTSTYALYKSEDDEVRGSPNYAILSHRWEREEVTFEMLNSADWRASNLNTPRMNKIKGACTKAREEEPPLEWLWVDTCCIDKTSSVELTTSINSMFEWYYRASVCYAFLCDIPDPKSLDPLRPDQKSVWFERGWTLQELLAPRNMEFYAKDWSFLGTRKNLADILCQMTSIDKKYLIGASSFKQASVATRMKWMAGRTTTMVEDIAYGMLGLLNVNMPVQYGEGTKAFVRLQRTLMESSTDESIFAWTNPTEGLACYRSLGQTPTWAPQSWGLIAPSPDCFKTEGDLVILPEMCVPRLSGGYRWIQQGVQFQMPMKSGTEVTNMFGLPRKEVTLALNCWRYGGDGKPLNISIQLLKTGDTYRRVNLNALGEKRGGKPQTNSVLGIDQVITRPLTIAQPEYDPFV